MNSDSIWCFEQLQAPFLLGSIASAVILSFAQVVCEVPPKAICVIQPTIHGNKNMEGQIVFVQRNSADLEVTLSLSGTQLTNTHDCIIIAGICLCYCSQTPALNESHIFLFKMPQ